MHSSGFTKVMQLAAKIPRKGGAMQMGFSGATQKVVMGKEMWL